MYLSRTVMILGFKSSRWLNVCVDIVFEREVIFYFPSSLPSTPPHSPPTPPLEWTYRSNPTSGHGTSAAIVHRYVHCTQYICIHVCGLRAVCVFAVEGLLIVEDFVFV
jgi:hypothetical protein